ncbi:hypothetical protein TVAG_042060 [Trichomonas vaginalis G3]|uniref:Uncharacterized protein n=1 Tax=Trichomonas vaginalis (strain ATCC PRA-98 / G3) TaxID=412133 RepID=A2EUU5_TRIV3|nr:hypothetical protein TVAGG3_0192160 [Trichomonas vaginalis G3]EAY03554.1 hypothetical protein TVAG_042060 [Trichomonas vaginalis G3]KAI5550055.1 hypothetical protein TVAGG3_0192160 [Trichomonas vaginalis G3]|eukprot:XP_001315777.1 hypothetical protein [Trichomonas vaginalis G3]
MGKLITKIPDTKQRSIDSFFFKMSSKESTPKPEVKEVSEEITKEEEIVPSSPIASPSEASHSDVHPVVPSDNFPTHPIHKLKRTISAPHWLQQEQAMRIAHFQIEVNERQYLTGHLASTEPLIIKKSIDTNNLSNSDMQTLHNYKVELEENVIPTFWPSRAWDGDYIQLSRKESQALQQKIDDVINSKVDFTKPQTEKEKVKKIDIQQTKEVSKPIPHPQTVILSKTINEAIESKKEPLKTQINIPVKNTIYTDHVMGFSDSSDFSLSYSDSEDERDLIIEKSESESIIEPPISKNIRDRTKNPVIYFSTKYFNTDDEDDLTDWEAV